MITRVCTAYCERKQIALHLMSFQKEDTVVNPQYYRRIALKQIIDVGNVLMEQNEAMNFSIYDKVLHD